MKASQSPNLPILYGIGNYDKVHLKTISMYLNLEEYKICMQEVEYLVKEI